MVSVYYVEGKDMYIETKRLVLRELLEEEAEVLLEISNDKQVKNIILLFLKTRLWILLRQLFPIFKAMQK